MSRKLIFKDQGWKDYQEWQQDKKILKRINTLIDDILRDPERGIGKPEPLKYDLMGCYSRRIDERNRIVYKIYNDSIEIVSCKTHYNK